MRIVIVGYGKMLAALVSGAKTITGNKGSENQSKGHEIVGALRVDRVKYSNFTLFFKDIFAPSTDYSFLKSHKIYDIKAPSVNSKEFTDEIKKLSPDIILVGSWSEKFNPEILALPKFGVVNCHPSLLPKHRGANPYFWAIYSGDNKTGVTFHLMDENIDTGKILMQAAFKIDPDMTGGDLRDRAANIAGLMVPELLYDIENNKIIPLAQDENEANYDKYPFQGINFIDFNESAKRVYDRIRALKPWANCFCNIGGTIYKVKNAKISETELKKGCCGTIAEKTSDKVFKIFCTEGIIEVEIY